MTTRPAWFLAGVVLLSAGCTAPAVAPTPPAPTTSAPIVSLGGRAVHTATPLADGSVLVAGGCDIDGCGRATASTYLLTTAGARPMAPLLEARDGHTAIRLADGRVLVVGGYAGEGGPPLATAEIFDPATGAWQSTGPLDIPRGGHAAARLGDGRVLVIGGWIGRQRWTGMTEIFDPATGDFGHGPDLTGANYQQAAVGLSDGSVLVTGGRLATGGYEEGASAAAVVVSRDGRTFRRVGDLAQARFKHTMLPWADGTVLVIGGTSDDRRLLTSTEVYDPRTGTFRPGPRLAYGRYKLDGGAVRLPDGRIVVAGGGPGAELLDPRTRTATPVDRLPVGVASFGTLSVVGDDLWLVGGYDRRIDLTGRDVRVPLAALP